MKATGIVRHVDELGRVVLPSELRKMLHINVRDALEVYTDGDLIILKKYEPACIFTNTTDDLIVYKDRKVSKAAIKEMAELAGLI
ncbi:MAG: AbrB/MazE/SpoVT family DNA-binding domain-containing protein [Clostridiales bacterium]|jgi:transcriptional pleiotropic regulator of transition state genes|nr:AbrB/MazE/SpoVT family DNA-binding domain-containing protein [Clostridiales bacterium]